MHFPCPLIVERTTAYIIVSGFDKIRRSNYGTYIFDSNQMQYIFLVKWGAQETECTTLGRASYLSELP